MTYIFDTGGYLPNKEHCLMIGGKYQDITLDDIISFASLNGIRAPKTIIRQVAAAVASFRSLAEKNGVREEWIGRVEATIINHLKAWGEWKESDNNEITIKGHLVSNIRIEQAYKGNFHLLATIDGKEHKYIIGKNKASFAQIEKTGIAHLSAEQLKALAETCFILFLGVCQIESISLQKE